MTHRWMTRSLAVWIAGHGGGGGLVDFAGAHFWLIPKNSGSSQMALPRQGPTGRPPEVVHSSALCRLIAAVPCSRRKPGSGNCRRTVQVGERSGNPEGTFITKTVWLWRHFPELRVRKHSIEAKTAASHLDEITQCHGHSVDRELVAATSNVVPLGQPTPIRVRSASRTNRHDPSATSVPQVVDPCVSFIV